MTRFKLSFAAAAAASVLAFSPAQAELVISTGRADDRPVCLLRRADAPWRRTGSQGSERRRSACWAQKVELIIGDDACDPKQAVAVAKKLVSQKVVFVGGHFCSGSSIPASKVYTAGRILQISPASTNPKLNDEGAPNVFRVCGRDDQQGMVAGNYLAKNFAGKKIAFLHDKDGPTAKA